MRYLFLTLALSFLLLSPIDSPWAITIDEYIAQAESLSSAENYDSAVVIYTVALQTARLDHGPDDTSLSPIYLALGLAYQNAGDYRSADSLIQTAVELLEAAHGPNHVDVAFALEYLGTNYFWMGRIDDAEPVFERILAIREVGFDSLHPQVVLSLTNLGLLNWYQSDFVNAEKFYIEALARSRNNPRVSDTALGEAISNLAVLYSETSRYQESLPLSKEALEIYERTFGRNHPQVAICANNTAVLLKKMGLYEQAEPMYARALSIREAELEEGDPDLCTSIANLAVYYDDIGRFRDAEVMYERILRSFKARNQQDSLDLSRYNSNLAGVYQRTGRTRRAEDHYRLSLTILDSARVERHSLRATCINNLATLMGDMGRHEEAIALHERALTLRVDIYGERDREVALSLTNIAAQKSKLGHFREAIALLEQAYDIYVERLGKSHRQCARTMNNMAVNYANLAEYDTADSLYRGALEIIELTVGAENMMMARTLTPYSRMLRESGRLDEALAVSSQAAAIDFKHLDDNSLVMTEREALLFSNTRRHAIDNFLSCVADVADRESELSDQALTLAMLSKGRVSDAMYRRAHRIASADDAQVGRLLQQIRIDRHRLSQLVMQGIGGTARDSTLIDSLRNAIKGSERSLATVSLRFRQQKRLEGLTINNLRDRLPESSALVDYIRTRYESPSSDLTHDYYLMLVVTSDGTLAMISLGKAAPIDSLVDVYRDHMAQVEGVGAALADTREYRRIAGELYRNLIMPAHEIIAKSENVFVSPDGPLSLVSFAGLVTDNDRYLIEDHSIHYLSAGRDLARSHDREAAHGRMIALGDPDFEATAEMRRMRLEVPPTLASTPVSEFALRSSCDEFERIHCDPLPYTAVEVKSIAEAWRTVTGDSVSLLQGSAASEEMLKELGSGCQVMHLATHGFFLDRECGRESQSVSSGGFDEFPLLNSGLLLAGANLPVEPDSDENSEDGRLTAYEVASMDLSSVELVVLSACETGLGSIENAEGVFGLRRSFIMAGAASVVSTLWRVPDDATAVFMRGLYDEWERPLHERIRRLQLKAISDARASGQSDHPFTWGPFVAYGNWH